eukprot:642119-Prymnesium_polylepis.2
MPDRRSSFRRVPPCPRAARLARGPARARRVTPSAEIRYGGARCYLRESTLVKSPITLLMRMRVPGAHKRRHAACGSRDRDMVTT